jgi:carbamoyltransferase
MAQRIFERFAVQLATHLRRITGSSNLCVAGGCGLNIDANRKFFTEAGFKNVFIQPASSDSGIALGCALWGWHVIAKQPRLPEMKNASLGRSYSDKEIETALQVNSPNVVWRKVEHIATETAKILAEDKIVGWFQGGSEYGPRALGYRSILCDPRGEKTKETLNLRVKHRENWRPFAASVLFEKMSEWFDIDVPSPFMLLMADVTKKKMGTIPAVTHVDGTCRLQSLTREGNGLYYDLVKAFDDLTGVPMVLNTSFNLAGEAIVETPEDAVRTFLATDFDTLVLGNYIVTKAAKN